MDIPNMFGIDAKNGPSYTALNSISDPDMKYLILARRYRPQLFCDVVGQEAILTTLKNALRFDRVAHAYLFCGSRGVGKTTIARLFAKALNCQSPRDDFEPCNECPSCKEIISGQSLDVIEIDGASNRGIDDIRQLNETVACSPSRGKYKIYIIDEVHMLTKEAFNALLKTLEEPPERAKFFFATTEPHKVLPTIISRCQRFDLQRLMEKQISEKIQAIALELSRPISPEAVHLISAFSDGSLRDAESLLDQILCFCDRPIEAEHVRNILGLVSDELFVALDRAFSENHLPFAFELAQELYLMGKDISHFAEQLLGHYRQLLVAKIRGVNVLDLPEPLHTFVKESSQLYSVPQLFFIFETLLQGVPQLHKSTSLRVSLESLLLTILRSKNRIPIEVIARRLSEIESQLLGSNLDVPFPKEEKPPIAAAPKEVTLERAPLALPASPIPSMTIVAPPEKKTYLDKLDAKDESPPSPATPKIPSKDSCHFDTMMRFAAIELEGTINSER